MSTERKQDGKECVSCADTGFIWLGCLQRLARCPVCYDATLSAGISEPDAPCEQEDDSSYLTWSGNLRAQVFAHYGTECACCGTTEDLSIDHVNGNGREHREELFGNPRGNRDGTYRWLIKMGFPGGFQVLCRPCNSSKGRGEYCRMPWHWRGATLVPGNQPREHSP